MDVPAVGVPFPSLVISKLIEIASKLRYTGNKENGEGLSVKRQVCTE
jgi:hypothetical protein